VGNDIRLPGSTGLSAVLVTALLAGVGRSTAVPSGVANALPECSGGTSDFTGCEAAGVLHEIVPAEWVARPEVQACLL
jgi:hypothetical protein